MNGGANYSLAFGGRWRKPTEGGGVKGSGDDPDPESSPRRLLN